jgi:hypothetical protein
MKNIGFDVYLQHVSHDLKSHFFTDTVKDLMVNIKSKGRVVLDNEILRRTGRHTGSEYVIVNDIALLDQKLAIFGDSYSFDAGLAAVMSYLFKEVSFVWSKDVNWEHVESRGSDVILWESAERYLASVPNV